MTKILNLLVVIALLALVGGGYYWYTHQELVMETVEVTRQTVIDSVEFKGHVEAEEVVQLGFERAGVVTKLNVEVGQAVTAGSQLAQLDSRISELEVAQAFAERVSQRDQARIARDEAQAAYTNTTTENKQQLELKQQAVRDAKAELDQAREIWQQAVRESDADSLAAKSKHAVTLAMQTIYNTAREDLQKTQESIDMSNQSAADSLKGAEEAYRAVVQASGSVAGLSALEAGEEKARVQLAKDILTAPINGTVTATGIKANEVAIAGEPLITIQTTDQKQITAEVDEIDIAKVAVGAVADITFDAYPGETWSATVIKIDPAGVVKDEDDVTYKVTLRLAQDETRLLPALTARVKIVVTQRADVLAVPRLAVEHSGAETYVYVPQGGTALRRLVTVGLTGMNGLVEITSGLRAGESILRRPPV